MLLEQKDNKSSGHKWPFFLHTLSALKKNFRSKSGGAFIFDGGSNFPSTI